MLKWILALLVLVAILAIAGYLYVDQTVKSGLNNPPSLSAAVALTDRARVYLEHLDRNRLLAVLRERSYTEDSDGKLQPGEFAWTADGLQVQARPITDSQGQKRSAKLQSFAWPPQSEPDRPLVLEPFVLSTLDNRNTRASKQVALTALPPHLIDAVIAIEDSRFFDHFGLDLLGILRALAANIEAGAIVQGGSTITQQLAKNLFFSPKRTFARKLMEAFAAISLEQRLSKNEILERYLNEVYLGQEGSVGIHGVAEAARSFFGKSVERLSMGESALLAGIIRAPSYYAPQRHPQRAKERRDLVLSRMAELKMISKSERETAESEPIETSGKPRYQRKAAYYIAALLKELEGHLHMEAALRTGVQVNTGIDLEMQRCAENAVQEVLGRLERERPALKRRKGPLEAALVAIEPFSGRIRAWVGGRNYRRSQFDRVNQAQRQIGSTIKPFLYLTALDRELNDYRAATPISILTDRPVQIPLPDGSTWEPHNFDNRYRGDVTLRYALEHSLNIPAVQIVRRVGPRALAETIESFRLDDQVLAVPALALGAIDTSLLRLTAAFAALANGGIYTEPRLFLSVSDKEGNQLIRSEIRERRAADPNAVYVLNNILQGVVNRGTGRAVRRAGFKFPIAGKTGTSNDMRDAWFVGFSPTIVAGVWVGFDDNSPIGLTGGAAAAPLWAEFMNCAAPFYPQSRFLKPPGVVSVDIDGPSGLLASPYCPSNLSVREVFVSGTEPTRLCGSPSQQRQRRAIEKRLPEERRFPTPIPRRRSMWDFLFSE